eukprot:6212905-Pleurochrysis_carterae.AAC.1
MRSVAESIAVISCARISSCRDCVLVALIRVRVRVSPGVVHAGLGVAAVRVRRVVTRPSRARARLILRCCICIRTVA